MKTDIKPWIFGGVLIVVLTTCRDKIASPMEQAKRVNEQRFDATQEKDAGKLVEASASNIYETMLSDTALDKAITDEVRTLAENLKKMHIQMNSELLVLASKKNVSIPADITKSQKRDMSRMSRRKGLDFDKDIVKHLRNKHEDSKEFYSDLMESTDDPQVKEFARNALSQVETHLQMIDRCWDKIKDRKPPRTAVDHGPMRFY
jgi:putative membrane protein